IRSITDEQDVIALSINSSNPIIVNTGLVRPDEYPKSHKDLLDPKWKGKIAMTEVSQSGSGAYTFSILKKELGVEYWERMKEQNIAFFKDQGEVGRRVATGESHIALSLGPVFISPFLTAGAPIKLLPAAEGSYKTFLPLYLVNNAPNPNSGKVLINFMLTKQGQEILARLFSNEPLRKDVEFKTHPEIQRWLDGTPKWTMGTMENVAAWDADVAAGTAQKVLGLK
ncbi:MAG: extracellular solute-binding protein, partial [Chloroflexota bacterium]